MPKLTSAFVKAKQVVGVRDLNPPDLRTTVIRTCRQTYEEALPVLYGGSFLVFGSPGYIEWFPSRGLVIGRMARKCSFTEEASYTDHFSQQLQTP